MGRNWYFQVLFPFHGPLARCFHLSYCFTKYLILPPMLWLAQFWTVPAGMELWITNVATGNTFYSPTLYTCSELFQHIQGCFLSCGNKPSPFPWKYPQFWASDLRQLYLKWPLLPQIKQWVHQSPKPSLRQSAHPSVRRLGFGGFCGWFVSPQLVSPW